MFETETSSFGGVKVRWVMLGDLVDRKVDGRQ